MVSNTRPGYTTRAKEFASSHPYTAWACTEAVLLTALILLGLSVDGGRVTSQEAALFRWVNGLPEALDVPMTIFQFAGVLAAGSVRPSLLICKRYRLAVALVLIMPAKLWSEHVIKSTSSGAAQGLTSPMPSCAVTCQPPDSALCRDTRPCLRDCHRADAIHLATAARGCLGDCRAVHHRLGLLGGAPIARRPWRRDLPAR